MDTRGPSRAALGTAQRWGPPEGPAERPVSPLPAQGTPHRAVTARGGSRRVSGRPRSSQRGLGPHPGTGVPVALPAGRPLTASSSYTSRQALRLGQDDRYGAARGSKNPRHSKVTPPRGGARRGEATSARSARARGEGGVGRATSSRSAVTSSGAPPPPWPSRAAAAAAG